MQQGMIVFLALVESCLTGKNADHSTADGPAIVTMVTIVSQHMQNRMRDPGIEPGSVPWQGTILPLNQPR